MSRPVLLVVLLLAGCRAAEPPRPDTGARTVAFLYFEALALQDWDRAYALLHPEAKGQLDRAAFETRARQYRSQLGFVPAKVIVRSCDEQDGQATAHVVITDDAGSMKHRFQDATTLRRIDGEWRVVLAPTFGVKR